MFARSVAGCRGPRLAAMACQGAAPSVRFVSVLSKGRSIFRRMAINDEARFPLVTEVRKPKHTVLKLEYDGTPESLDGLADRCATMLEVRASGFDFQQRAAKALRAIAADPRRFFIDEIAYISMQAEGVEYLRILNTSASPPAAPDVDGTAPQRAMVVDLTKVTKKMMSYPNEAFKMALALSYVVAPVPMAMYLVSL